MFLLVSGLHVGAHLDGHQHGVSIQISINLGKTVSRTSYIGEIAVTWSLARVCIFTFFFFSESGLYLSIERFWFFDFDLQGVTLKTSNMLKLANFLFLVTICGVSVVSSNCIKKK